MSTGPYERKDGKWCPTLVMPDGSVLALGEFATRAEARVAYMAKHREIYPQPAPSFDELLENMRAGRHDSLNAASLVVKTTYH